MVSAFILDPQGILHSIVLKTDLTVVQTPLLIIAEFFI